MAADQHRRALAEEIEATRARLAGLVSRLEVDADDVRTYARDGLIGIHPDQAVMRDWASLMEEAATEIAAVAEIEALSGREVEAMRAEAFARRAHAGQVDKAGQPYTGHLGRVAARAVAIAEGLGLPQAEIDRCRAVGWLHDTIEDTGETIETLEAAGFEDDIIVAVDALSKNGLTWAGRSDSYVEWVAWICRRDRIATIVKLADAEDNLDPSRPGTAGLSDRHRARYEAARQVLRRALTQEGRSDG